MDVNQRLATDRWIDAAGGVTMVSGVMTAMLAAGLVVTGAIVRTAGQPLPWAESAVILLAGTGLVLLGWGVLQHIRLCAATAAILAGAILALEVLWRVFGNHERGSTYLLVVPVFVLAGNWLAWLEMKRGASAGQRPGVRGQAKGND